MRIISFWGEIYFTDSAGKPIPNLDFELNCNDVTTQFVKSDANGKYTFKYVYSKPMYTHRNPVRVYAMVRENDKYVHSYGEQYYHNPIKWFHFITHEDEKYKTATSITYPFNVTGGEIVEEIEVLKHMRMERLYLMLGMMMKHVRLSMILLSQS